mgnify:CR=1 FL=1|jgi:hypothetical protein
MEATYRDGNYDFFMNDNEIIQLNTGKLEAVLKESGTDRDLRKKISLEVSEDVMGDADFYTLPEGSSFKDAESLNFKIRPNPYLILRKNGAVSGRLPCGDVYLHNSGMPNASFINH